MNYYISDLHLGHLNAILFDKRPFVTLDEMHKTIINNWNNAVNEDDNIYVLGDFAWDNNTGIEVISKLKGKKHLIKGNHDRLSPELARYFTSIKEYNVIKDGINSVFNVVLCHYPIAHWKNADRGYIHLYGHIHQGRDSDPFERYVFEMQQRKQPYLCYNVGCMMPYINYTPQPLYKIIGIDKQIF